MGAYRARSAAEPERVGEEPPLRWSWRVGVVEVDDQVRPHKRGSEITLRVGGAGPVPDALVGALYGPAAWLVVRNLARMADAGAPAARDGG